MNYYTVGLLDESTRKIVLMHKINNNVCTFEIFYSLRMSLWGHSVRKNVKKYRFKSFETNIFSEISPLCVVLLSIK